MNEKCSKFIGSDRFKHVTAQQSSGATRVETTTVKCKLQVGHFAFEHFQPTTQCKQIIDLSSGAVCHDQRNRPRFGQLLARLFLIAIVFAKDQFGQLDANFVPVAQKRTRNIQTFGCRTV